MVDLIHIFAFFTALACAVFGIMTVIENFINLRRKRVRGELNEYCYWLNMLGLHENADMIWEVAKADMKFIRLKF